MFLTGKLEYLRGDHKKALSILKEIPVKDDFKYECLTLCILSFNLILLFIRHHHCYRETGECSSVLINNNMACLYHYNNKPTLSFTSVYKAIVQHQKNITDVTKPNQGMD